MCVYKLFSGKVYIWLFVITKFVRYTNLYLSAPWSAAIFHAIMAISIFPAPIIAEETFISKDMIPPGLEVNPLESGADKAVENCNEDETRETDVKETESAPK